MEGNTTPIKVNFDPARSKVVPLKDAQFYEAADNVVEIPQAFIDAVQECITPQLYWYVLCPVNVIRETKGGIILADSSVDHQKWTHGLAEVIHRGKAVYRGRTFADLGLTQDDAPVVGDIVTYDPKAPKRFEFDGIELVLCPDHALFASLKKSEMHRVSYRFGF